MKRIFRKILAEIAAGLAQAMTMAPCRPYTLPAQQAFRKDAAALQHDARRIGDDLNNNFRQ